MKLAIAAAVKNEAPYLDEWILFHNLQGVSAFFLYDNSSTDKTKATARKHQDVHLFDYPTYPIQPVVFTDALWRTKGKFDWVAFIDVDEFLYSPTGELLPSLLKKYRDYAAVSAHWRIFGSNGYQHPGAGLTIEKYTKRAKDVNKHCKSIVQPEKILRIGKDPHTFVPLLKEIIVNEQKQQLPTEYALATHPTAHLLCINHYYCKSYVEAQARWKEHRNKGNFYLQNKFEEAFKAHDSNDVEDTYLSRKYAPMIHAAQKAIATQEKLLRRSVF